MRKILILALASLLILSQCQKREEDLFTVGIFQVNDAPTLNEVRKGLLQALEDSGLKDGVNVRLIFRNAMNDLPEVQRIAQEFVQKKVDMIIPLSTPCLQAALISTKDISIIFASVANPYRAGVGKSAENHLSNVSGVSSRGPIKQAVDFIKEVMPEAKRLGTLWTPSEINSEYYLELAKEGANELGMEVIAVPVANSNEVLLSAQVLINKKIDAIYQISDNTINASFEALGRVANDLGIPLFGGFPLFAHKGACAAMGWDFFDMGYRAGEIALRVKNGENPGGIPIQYMSEVRLYLNLKAAEKQGVKFSPQVIQRADEVLDTALNNTAQLEI